MGQGETSTVWALLKLFTTLAVFAGIAYTVMAVIKAVNEGVATTKDHLGKKGISISKSGVAVKTYKRARTQEETADAIQAGIMKGWKNSTFQVPWALAKGSNLSGSSHDKNKAEWEKTHGGPKK